MYKKEKVVYLDWELYPQIFFDSYDKLREVFIHVYGFINRNN